jgi:hypothetical protein
MPHSLSMPHRIIHPRIVWAMKPHALLAALMNKAGLNSNKLAKEIKRPTMQSQIYRFSKGQVLEPARNTAEPLALHFGIPVDALYNEKTATAVAKELGLSELPAQLARASNKKNATAVLAKKLVALSQEEFQDLEKQVQAALGDHKATPREAKLHESLRRSIGELRKAKKDERAKK